MEVEQTLQESLRNKIQQPRVGIIALAFNFPGNFSCAPWKLLANLHSLKSPFTGAIFKWRKQDDYEKWLFIDC